MPIATGSPAAGTPDREVHRAGRAGTPTLFSPSCRDMARRTRLLPGRSASEQLRFLDGASAGWAFFHEVRHERA